MANEIYQITEKDFLSMVTKPHCIGSEKHNGTATEGHPNCKHCKGNYFVGGECNYGGKHLMFNDLRVINENFAQFGVLVSKQIEISQSKNEKEFERKKKILISKFQELESKCNDETGQSLLRGSCIGLDGTENAFNKKVINLLRLLARQLREYIDKAQKSTWEQLQAFNTKLDELDKMQTESTRLKKAWKEETDPVKKQQLFILLQEQRKKIAIFQVELKNDPVYELFSEEQNINLSSIVEKIIRGQSDFLVIKNEEEKEEKQEQGKYLGFIPKKWGRKVLWGGIIIIILLVLFFFVRWVKKNLE